MKRIFVFTGGGLAPALNPTLYGVIQTARREKIEVIGGLYGWASLLRNGRMVSLDAMDIESLKDRGGTVLRSSRTNPLAIPNGLDQVKEHIRELAIDAIIAIGGNDTLGAAARLSDEGIPIVGVPKTIDNDLPGTYMTPGFPSAAFCLGKFVREIKEDAAYALSRIFIIESLGMHAGWLTAAATYGHADIILPPEKPHRLRTVIDLVNKRYEENGNFAVMVVAQEASFDEPLPVLSDQQPGEQYGHTRQQYICLALREKIKSTLGIDTKALYPGNFLETGDPIPVDRDLAIALGESAVRHLLEKKIGTMMSVVRPDPKALTLSVTARPLKDVLEKKFQPLPETYFDYSTLQPTKHFMEYMEPLLGKKEASPTSYETLMKKITDHASPAHGPKEKP